MEMKIFEGGFSDHLHLQCYILYHVDYNNQTLPYLPCNCRGMRRNVATNQNRVRLLAVIRKGINDEFESDANLYKKILTGMLQNGGCVRGVSNFERAACNTHDHDRVYDRIQL